MGRYKKTTTNLANKKSPGLNGVPPNAFKALDDKNISRIILFYNQLWCSQDEFHEWNEGQVVTVTKKGDTSNPKKLRGFTLMDIGKKIYSSIMCGRLFKISRKHSVKCQFRSTPGFGYQDYTFKMKTLINLRQNHNLPTYVAFTYPLKAFNTSNHALLIAILGKYGAPNKTMIRNQMHVLQKRSQACHWQD